MKNKGKIFSIICVVIFIIVFSYLDLNQSTIKTRDTEEINIYSLESPTNSTCFDCHTKLSGMINNRISKPVQEWQESIHFSSEAIVMCSGCHGGNSSTNIISDAKSNTSGYERNAIKQKRIELCGSCHESEFQGFQNSAHWSQKDNNSKITCTDCHSTHNILASNDENSLTYVKNEPKTCGKCHEDEYEMYYYTFHSKHLNLGNTNVAVCSDCHNPHYILPKSDPNSTINPKNLPEVCSKCHKNDFDEKISEGIFHDDKESHTPNLIFDKDKLNDSEKLYYIGPFDLGFYIPFAFGALKVLVVFSLISIILFETVISKTFRRD